ncbi:hypothetical protein Taro_030736 [Colocasia esculenta]|uniref:VQ domain-containing protein n=1 Tax=Colocasia esculenta TaxID=4460 RepID=A0A843W128_COLES|nr:hypothetical protein [Colocasia esculenta]
MIAPSSDIDAESHTPATPEDAFISVMGKDRPGRVHCAGSGEMLGTWYRSTGMSDSSERERIMQEQLKAQEEKLKAQKEEMTQMRETISRLENVATKVDEMSILLSQIQASHARTQHVPPAVQSGSDSETDEAADDYSDHDDHFIYDRAALSTHSPSLHKATPPPPSSFLPPPIKSSGGGTTAMDPSEYYSSMGRPSPRREVQLQGPRPTPLKVRKDSHKIKKPPAAPGAGPSQPHHYPPPQQQQQPQQHRAPVIIYTVSPKVIHTEPGNFMTLVQRLTGASPRTLAAAAGPSSDAHHFGSDSSIANHAPGELSPAARFAVMERAAQSSSPGQRAAASGHDDFVEQLGIGGAADLDRGGAGASFPGILSPLPTALPPISPTFFSPPAAADPASMTFLNEMSPLFRATGAGSNNSSGFMDGPFLPSPGNFLSTPTLPSPGAFWEFFSQL